MFRLRMAMRYIEQVRWNTVCVHYINVSTILLVMAVGYAPFVQTILRYNRDTPISKAVEPACQNTCVVSFPRLSVDKLDSFSLDSIHVLFVHFSGYNLSLNPSDTTDVLDPLNLLWVESNDAPFLSLDLGFNAYSFTTLSRVVHHMKVKVEVEPINCLKNMSYSCVTANLARTFLGNVTKERGVLCYAVNDSNTVNYRCCKGNVHTQQVECDIPAVFSQKIANIFKTIAITTAIALLCFPALFNIVPDIKNSETLRSNNKMHNPLYHLIIDIVQALRHYSTEHYWINVIRKLLIGLALPMLYYVHLVLQWYTKTYDIPEMFNDAVKKLWVESNNILPTFLVIVFYNSVVASLLPRTENLNLTLSPLSAKIKMLLEKENDIKLNWNEPLSSIKDYFWLFISLFRKATDNEKSFCSRFAALLGSIVLMLLSPVVTILIFISYIGQVSPLGKMTRSFIYHAFIHCSWCRVLEKLYSDNRFCYIKRVVMLVVLGVTVAIQLAVFSFVVILNSSLLLSLRLIVYLWMGLVTSKDHYFPLIAMFSVGVYYCWNCLGSVTSRDQILLKQTFEKCKEHQEKQPNGRKAVTFDDKGVPRISSKLFQQVIEQILPRNEVYTKMIVKLFIISLFLGLIFSPILVYGKSNLDESTKALALLLSGVLPKLFEIFGEGSSYQQLCEMENAFRVEKIVKDFLSKSTVNSYINNGPTHDTSSDDGTSMSDDEQQPPSNPSGDQPPAANTNERDQPTSTEHSVPKPAHSKVRSKESSKGNRRGDKNLLVVQADVNPRMPSINSSNDASTEETPLLLEYREKRDRNTTIV